MDPIFENLVLKKNGGDPLYAQLEKFIADGIQNNDFKAGDYLPPEEEIAAYYNISRPTVRHAFQNLMQKGYVQRQKAKGTRVLPKRVDGQFFNKIISFDDEMIEKGIVPSTKVIHFEPTVIPEDIQSAMGVKSTDGIYLERVRYGDGIPMVNTVTYMPYIRCFPLMNCDLEKINLYHAMAAEMGERVVRVKRSIQAKKADAHIAQMLECSVGTPVLKVFTNGYNQNGELLEYSIADYHGERNVFNIELRG